MPGPTVREALPHVAPKFDDMMERLDVLLEDIRKHEGPVDGSLARRFINALYFDYGHPVFNSGAQDVICDFLRDTVRRKGLAPDGKRALTEGMLKFVRDGGGQYRPTMQARAAATLAMVAPDDPEAQEAVDALLQDALCWAEAVDFGRDEVYKWAERIWGPEELEARLLDLALYGPTGDAECARALDKAVAGLRRSADALRDTTLSETARLSQFRGAEQALLKTHVPKPCESQVTSLLLRFYRLTLERAPRFERLEQYVGDRLTRLGVRSRRLESLEHWRLWAEAVRALGADRMPTELREFIRRGPRRPPSQSVQSLFNDLREFAGSG